MQIEIPNEEFYKSPKKPNPQQYCLRRLLMENSWLTAKEIYEKMKGTEYPFVQKSQNFTGSVGRAIGEAVEVLNLSGEFDKMIISDRSKGYSIATESEFGAYADRTEKSLKASLWKLSVMRHFANRNGQMILPDPNHPYQREFRETFASEKKITLSEIIKDSEVVIHCPKKEQAKAYGEAMAKREQVWINHRTYIEQLAEDSWQYWTTETCFRPSLGKFDSMAWYRKNGYTIYEFDQVDFGRKENR